MRTERSKVSSVTSVGAVPVLMFSLCSCLAARPSEPGFRDFPNICSVISPETARRYLGSGELSDFPVPGGVKGPDRKLETDTTTGSCTWKAEDPPDWGDFGSAEIRVYVALSNFSNGDPDVADARGRYQLTLKRGKFRLLPTEHGIGAESAQSYEESGLQQSEIAIRNANAEIDISYKGWGHSNTGHDVFLPREQMENAVRDMAIEVNRKLGQPR
jgi:hypothetical protein